MRKIILTLLFLFPFTSFAQSFEYFHAYSLSVKVLTNNGWSEWSEWESVSIPIKIDAANNKIIVYSNEPQIYYILEQKDSPYDDNGEQLKYSIIDQDGDYGHIRVRRQYNGRLQLYVDFADIKWVYNFE